MGWAEIPDQYWERVVEHASEALRLDATDVRARILLGRKNIAYNQFDEAQTEIDRAIAINPSDADALAGRGNVLVWLGETDAAVQSLEQALRVDPEINAFDRFALSLAYFLKKRYAESISQSELNLRHNADARFSRVVLAVALAEAGRMPEAKQAADEVRRTDPTFDAASFGNKFRDGSDLAHLRKGLPRPGSTCQPAGEFWQQSAIVFGTLDAAGEFLAENLGADRLAEQIQPSVVDQPDSGLASRTSPRASATAQKLANCGA